MRHAFLHPDAGKPVPITPVKEESTPAAATAAALATSCPSIVAANKRRPCPFSQLPSDLLGELFLLCDLPTQYRLRATCRSLRAVGDSSIHTFRVRRQLVLTPAGTIPGSLADALPLLTRLRGLKTLLLDDASPLKRAPGFPSTSWIGLPPGHQRLNEHSPQFTGDFTTALSSLPNLETIDISSSCLPRRTIAALAQAATGQQERHLVWNNLNLTLPEDMVEYGGYHGLNVITFDVLYQYARIVNSRPDAAAVCTARGVSLDMTIAASDDGYEMDLLSFLEPEIGGADFDEEEPLLVPFANYLRHVERFTLRASETDFAASDVARIAALNNPPPRLFRACTDIRLVQIAFPSDTSAADSFFSSFLLPDGGASVSSFHLELCETTSDDEAGDDNADDAARRRQQPLPPALIRLLPGFTALRRLHLSGPLGDAGLLASFKAALAALPHGTSGGGGGAAPPPAAAAAVPLPPLESLEILSISGSTPAELLSTPFVRRCAASGTRVTISVGLQESRRGLKALLKELFATGAAHVGIALQEVEYSPPEGEHSLSEFDTVLSGFIRPAARHAAAAASAAAAGAGKGRRRAAARGGGGAAAGAVVVAGEAAAPASFPASSGAAGAGGAAAGKGKAKGKQGKGNKQQPQPPQEEPAPPAAAVIIAAPPPRRRGAGGLESVFLTVFEPYYLGSDSPSCVEPSVEPHSVPLTLAACQRSGVRLVAPGSMGQRLMTTWAWDAAPVGRGGGRRACCLLRALLAGGAARRRRSGRNGQQQAQHEGGKPPASSLASSPS